MFMTVVFVVVICSLAYTFFNKKAWDAGKQFPGPKTMPIIGNGHQLTKGGSIDFLRTIIEFWEEYGSRFRLFIGSQLYILLSDPKDVEVVLSGQQFIEKSYDYDFLMPWLGTGLLTSKGPKWQKHRKVITPTFHFKILENFLTIFDSQSDILIKQLSKYVNKGSFDVFPRITLCALDIMCAILNYDGKSTITTFDYIYNIEAAMGVSINAQDDETSEYVTAVKDMCRIMHSRMKDPLRRLDIMFQLTGDYNLQTKSLGILHKFTNDMIIKRREILQNSKESLSSYTDDSDILGVKKKMAFLDMLLLSTVDGKPLDNLSIREEVDTFLFEGHDTTTSGISFALYLIANHPEVQEKLYKEQQDIFNDDLDISPSHSDLQNMKYMELCIKESLRLYPSVPIIARRITQDCNINGMFLPKESTAMVLVYNMSRDPKIFEKPDSFIPDRFLPEETNKRSPFASVFFSAGPRNCIGQKFAMLEMKSTLSKILRHYKLESSGENVKLTADIILKSLNGVNIKIVSRK